MLTDRSLGELRAAATLTHSIPGLQASIRAAGVVVAEVRGGPAAEQAAEGEGPVTLSPCGLRAAVGKALQHQRAGRQLQFLDVPDGVDPEVELTSAWDDTRPGGIYGARLDDCRVWAFATALSPRVAHDLGRSIVDEVGDLPDLLTLGLRPDPVTEISLAFARTSREPGSAEEEAILELLQQLMARWTAYELLVSVGAERHGARPA